MKRTFYVRKMLEILFSFLVVMLFCQKTLAAESWLWPVEGYTNIVQLFHSGHNGIDISQGGIAGQPVRAAKSGTVTISRNNCSHISSKGNFCGNTDGHLACNGGAGNYVVIDHGDGTSTRYLHLQQGSAIEQGSQVSQGQVIGRVGTSGWSEGYHLHFEILQNGSPINNNTDVISYIYIIDPTMPNPIYKKSYWGPQTATTLRPIVEIKNPETVEKVSFPVWTADNQSDIKWVDAVHNGYGSFFADIPIEGFVSNNYKCHVYIYGKNGSDRSYILTADYPDPVYKLSYWGTQTETIRQPVISFRNSDMVEEVTFAVWTTENQSDLKWIKATPNGYGSWFTEFNVSEFTNRDFLCHAYVTGKNGDVRSYILTADYPDPVCKDSYILKLSETSITPVAEFSNPDMVEEVTFAIWTTENQSDIKWIKGFPNGYGSWANELSADDFTYRQFTCHIYIKGKNGSEQYVQMKDTFHLDEHQWGSPSYEWDNENNKLTATYICALNSNHIKTEVIDNPQVLRLPAQLQEIEEEAFTGLTCQVVIIPESCTIIGSRAFANCDELLYVDIPSTVSIIADDAFEGCDNYILPQ